MNDATWMQSANVKLAVYVCMAIMPNIIADLSANRVSWLTAALVLMSAFTAAKAFMSNPDSPPVIKPVDMTSTTTMTLTPAKEEPKPTEPKKE